MKPDASSCPPPPPLSRSFDILRRWLNLQRRALLVNSFRIAIAMLRAFHLLPRHAPKSRAREPLHLLVVNLTPHLGDTVLQMPLIEALRAAHPTARIELATAAAAAPLPQQMPQLDCIYALPLDSAPPVTFSLALRRSLQVTRAWWKQMRHISPDICLLPRWDNDQYRAQVLALLTGAPRRIGFSRKAVPGARPAPYRDTLLTDPIAAGSGLHESARFALLACNSGLIPPSALDHIATEPLSTLQHIAAAQDWPRLAARLEIDTGRPFVVIAPGATMPRRIWPIAHWAKVAHALRTQNFDIVLLSGAPDRAIAEAVDQAICETGAHRPVLAAGKTTLLESAALLSHASLFLGSDSGPGHLAGALGIPSVILFITVAGHDPDGVSAPERIRPTGPFVECCSPPHTLAPCHGACVAGSAHCITLISPQAVLDAAAAVLARARCASSEAHAVS